MDGANQTAGDAVAQRIDRCAMGEIDVVDAPMERVDVPHVAFAAAGGLREYREDRRLVKRGKAFDAVAVAVGDQSGVVGKPADDVPVGPAADVVERLRHIPVIKAEPRLDAGRQERIDQPVVESEPRLVRRPSPRRQESRPRHRKAVGLNAEALHQADVLGIAMVMVAGDVAGVLVGDLALQAVGIPDAKPPAVLARRALDLKCRRRYAPDEVAPQSRRRWKPRGCASSRRNTRMLCWNHRSPLQVVRNRYSA